MKTICTQTICTQRICVESAVNARMAELADGCYLALYTDRLTVGIGSEALTQIEKLLDLRVWNRFSELHLYREYPGMPFVCRRIDDAQRDHEEYFDEVQLLDIDAGRSVGADKVTAGGGSFRLPAAYADCDRIRLRSYVEYDENNAAVIRDWRIVGFEKEGAASGS